jgi:fluoride ion exporter CrcB/FEX
MLTSLLYVAVGAIFGALARLVITHFSPTEHWWSMWWAVYSSGMYSLGQRTTNMTGGDC